MSAPFDLTQTAFLFNWVANSSCQQQGTSQQLADYVYWSLFGPPAQPDTRTFPSLRPPGLLKQFQSQLLGGDWQLTWGPGVYEIDPSSGHADNTAYVVHSPSLDLYIVAIAGTDPHAFLDWLDEDFQVGPNDCVTWSGFAPDTGGQPAGAAANQGVAQISLGTALGVWALASQLTQSQFAPNPSSSNTLAAYLKSLQPSKTTTTRVMFTGHSLGGALSPTLANWFQQNTTIPLKQIFALPTAGPTPGNQVYQNAWDTSFPSVALTSLPAPFNYIATSANLVTSLNCDVWNQLDVVPHAWQYIYTSNYQAPSTPPGLFYFSEPKTALAKLAEIESLLGSIVPGTIFRSLANSRQTAGNAAGMWRSKYTISAPNVWPIQTDSGSVAQPTPPFMGDDSSFLAALGAIHVWGYGTAAFGIDLGVFQQLHATPVLMKS